MRRHSGAGVAHLRLTGRYGAVRRAGRGRGARSRRGSGGRASTSWPAGSSRIPVLVPLAGEDRAGVAAAHRDDDIGGADDLVGPRLRVLGGDVDAAFGHRGDRGRVDLDAGFGAAGPGDRRCRRRGAGRTRAPSGCGRRCGRTGTARPGVPSSCVPFDPGQCGQALAGEPFGQQRKEVGHGAAGGELVVAGVQEPFDGLGAVDAGELLAESCGGGAQGELLVDGQVVAVDARRLRSWSCSWEFRSSRAAKCGRQPVDPVGDLGVGGLERRVGVSRSPGRAPTSAAAAALGWQVLVGVVADRDHQIVALARRRRRARCARRPGSGRAARDP